MLVLPFEELAQRVLLLLRRRRLRDVRDDPVGATSVHLTCGIWGTLAVGLFSTNPEHSFVVQLIGVVAYGLFTVVCSAILFGIVKATMGLRVTEDEELEGLDLGEHGMHAYDIAPSTGPFDNAHLRAGNAPGASLATSTVAVSDS